MNTPSGNTWEPGVVYLLVLVVVEIIVMGVLRNLTAHGG